MSSRDNMSSRYGDFGAHGGFDNFIFPLFNYF